MAEDRMTSEGGPPSNPFKGNRARVTAPDPARGELLPQPEAAGRKSKPDHGNWSVVATRMLAADLVAARILATPVAAREAAFEWLHVSDAWRQTHLPSEVESTRETLETFEFITRRLVAMRLPGAGNLDGDKEL
jgi:hypothetical protein